MVVERLSETHHSAWSLFMQWFEQSLYFEYKDWETDEFLLNDYLNSYFDSNQGEKLTYDDYKKIMNWLFQDREDLQSILKEPFEWKEAIMDTIGINYWNEPRLPREGGGVFPATKAEFKAATGRDWDSDSEYIHFLNLCVSKIDEGIERAKKELSELSN